MLVMYAWNAQARFFRNTVLRVEDLPRSIPWRTTLAQWPRVEGNRSDWAARIHLCSIRHWVHSFQTSALDVDRRGGQLQLM